MVFSAAVIIINILGYTARQIAISFRQLHTQQSDGLTGLLFGLLYYFVSMPEPILMELTWQELLQPALILLMSAAFLQEFVFRGLIQSSAIALFGWLGIVYTSPIIAITHIRLLVIDIIIVFMIVLFLSLLVRKTGSILGAALSYGICNISLYLIIPPFLVSNIITAKSTTSTRQHLIRSAVE